MSISRMNKSTILEQKLDSLRTQRKKLRLIIAPPRSVSTAFTRALCHASDSDGVHELLHALEVTTNVVENIQPHKNDIIFKEMAHTENQNPTEYQDFMSIMMEKVQTPIVIITANPQTIFLSMMQASANFIIKYMQKDSSHQYALPKTTLKKFMIDYNRDVKSDVTYTNNNITQIHHLINDNPQKFLILNADNIKTNPQTAIDAVMQTWLPETSFGQHTLQLAPVVQKFTKQSPLSQTWTSFTKKEYIRNPEYLLAYDDPWVSSEDKAKEYFQPHSHISDNTDVRIENIKNSILTKLTSTFENIGQEDIKKFGLMKKIDDLITTGLSKIKNLSS